MIRKAYSKVKLFIICLLTGRSIVMRRNLSFSEDAAVLVFTARTKLMILESEAYEVKANRGLTGLQQFCLWLIDLFFYGRSTIVVNGSMTIPSDMWLVIVKPASIIANVEIKHK